MMDSFVGTVILIFIGSVIVSVILLLIDYCIFFRKIKNYKPETEENEKSGKSRKSGQNRNDSWRAINSSCPYSRNINGFNMVNWRPFKKTKR